PAGAPLDRRRKLRCPARAVVQRGAVLARGSPGVAVMTVALALQLWAGLCADRSPWPLWNAYVTHFISDDGRVIDPAAGAITTSEGQSYALFFALVANDRPLFLRLLAWTRDNLAGGRLGERLPAYKWGRRRDGAWGVLDSNSAADSDLWIA